MPAPLLEVNKLRVYFATGRRLARAVDGVSFSIWPGETIALVGESGCGKSVSALALARLVPSPPGLIAGGQIRWEGCDLLQAPDSTLRRRRGGSIAYIFQDPGAALNPVFRVGWQIAEAIKLHRPGIAARAETLRLLQLVGLSDPERHCQAYPHQLSGGMQQRIMIAMALASQPALLVADEPSTALDATIQAQIMELLVSLRQKLGMAMLLITHNLGLVSGVASRLYVMYAGQIVESGPTDQVLLNPLHPYTRGLLDAVPSLTEAAPPKGIPGSVPSLEEDLPPGCRFHPRCAYCQPICRRQPPPLAQLAAGRQVQCWLARGTPGQEAGLANPAPDGGARANV